MRQITSLLYPDFHEQTLLTTYHFYLSYKKTFILMIKILEITCCFNDNVEVTQPFMVLK